MRDMNGGEPKPLAPVIPLFGVRRKGPATPATDRSAAPATEGRRSEPSARAEWQRAEPADEQWHPDEPAGHGSQVDGGRMPAADGEQWHPTWQRDPEPARTPEPMRLRALRADDRGASDASAPRATGPFFREIADDQEPEDVDPGARVAAAERVLLRKLRARQLSVAESRTVLGGLDLDANETETLIDAFADRGYLDDARLAEQLIHVGTDRKGQGRRAIAQTLSSRGIPRDVADAVLAELPDDDADRALEFARTKARQLDRFDDATALRRLIGQLSRRGYPGSVAAIAARTALDENRSQSGVRFR